MTRKMAPMMMTTAAMMPSRAPLESPPFLIPPSEYMVAGWVAKVTVKFLYAPPVYLLATTNLRLRFLESIPKKNQLQVESPEPQGAQTSLSIYINAIRIQRLQTTAPHEQRSKYMPHPQPQTTLDAYLPCQYGQARRPIP
jgi:hypothetical protein